MSAYCPQCGTRLTPVVSPGGYLNEDQWDSQRAGDWYCSRCPPNGRAKRNCLCYWWKREVLASVLASQALEGVDVPYEVASRILDEVLREPMPRIR